jgi:hypothetical protein
MVTDVNFHPPPNHPIGIDVPRPPSKVRGVLRAFWGIGKAKTTRFVFIASFRTARRIQRVLQVRAAERVIGRTARRVAGPPRQAGNPGGNRARVENESRPLRSLAPALFKDINMQAPVPNQAWW